MAYIQSTDVTDSVVNAFDLTNYITEADLEVNDIAARRGILDTDDIAVDDDGYISSYKLKRYAITFVCYRVCQDKMGLNNNDLPVEIEKYAVKHKMYKAEFDQLDGQITAEMIAGEVDQFIPPQDHKIKRIYRDLVKKTQNLPADNSSFGLIHQDAHQGNFFVDENGKITIFDFDDSSYSWFVEDIALVLFYTVMGQEDPAGFTDNFLSGFLPGYFSEYDLDKKWFREIPLFMKRREIDLYAVIHRSFDVENLDDPWCVWYMDGRKERLEKEIPYLDFDFSNLDFLKFS